ncbi:GGDEF domain-containing protein [Cobetia sp. ICG0124]|uniref:GGDEF domain-containing protein n=1 Tax=Cobetia sp. ICG0124 TaxID=2053669 RepID=UPI000FDAA239|nr:GGDEF domain-containing protein [Cobetia sp. ICG0124]AZV31622.1 hypothetical protein CU110_09985 [Cobetia sp. ICG0124]
MGSPHPHLARWLLRFEDFPPGLTEDEKTFHATFNVVYVLAIASHLLYAGLMLWLGEMGILALDLGMLVVDLVCLQLHRARREVLAANLLALGTCAQISLSLGYFGPAPGFDYFYFGALLCIYCIRMPFTRRLLLCLICLSMPLLAYVVLMFQGVANPLPPGWAFAFRLINLCVLTVFFTLVLVQMGWSADRLRQRFESRERFDELTGALSRAELIDKGREMLMGTQPISVMMVDVDHLGLINETWGRAAGDQVLKELVKRMRSILRGEDLIGRYGGEEFVLLSPRLHGERADQVAERLCKGASALPFVINDGINSLDVSLSIGVAQRQSGDKDLESLIAKADVNLFRAKREGCNRFVSDNQLGPVSRRARRVRARTLRSPHAR